MKYDLKTERKNESGTIMLEIIAVLALMGVMGAMLFRQINHRNQELHNIQMASEIRVIKEAFSSWIQANLAVLRRDCPLQDLSSDYVQECESYNQREIETENRDDTASAMAINMQPYIPSGYIDVAQQDYLYRLFAYVRGEGAWATPVYYGLVIPKKNVLPDEGQERTSWNFKRAARVAMLIGGDGGVYDQSITTYLVGSVGSWELDISDLGLDLSVPVYGAITGLDVYQPEIEVADAGVSFPEAMDLQLKDLGAYGKFVVGGNSDCYQIGHDKLTNQIIQADSIHRPGESGYDDCKAVLWIDTEADGNVYTTKSIEAGYDVAKKSSAVSLTKSNDGGLVTVTDSMGRASIVLDGQNDTTAGKAKTLTLSNGKILVNETTGKKVGVGSQTKEYQYQVAPADVSVMYDIRLGAFGGQKLSELLPKAVLKDIGYLTGNGYIAKPTCPSGYVQAVLIIPGTAENSADPSVEISNDLSFVRDDSKNSSSTAGWSVSLNHLKSAAYQTYCLIDSITNDSRTRSEATMTEQECKAMGFGWSGGVCKNALTGSTIESSFTTEVDCARAGFSWNKATGKCRAAK